MSQLKFGDYISVEKKRFGAPNEHYTHKVIRTLQSNSWAEVPALTVQKSILHESIEDVVDCICCGVDESEVVRYRLSDVKFLRSDAHDKELEISAYQLSQQNIINAFGISGEGAHSKLVIEYVHGLVAENEALKAAFNPVEIPEDAVDAFGDTAEFDWDSNESGSWTWVENDTDVIRAVLDAMPKPATPNTDAAIAEIKSEEAQNMYESILDNPSVYDMESLVDCLESYAENKKAFAANLRAGRKG